AALLYAYAPPMAQWSLKVAGGHNVALLLVLIAVLLVERSARPPAVALLLPLAALAHPIGAPLAALLPGFLVMRTRSAERLATVGTLAGASAIAAAVLWPRGEGVWSPAPVGWDLVPMLKAIPMALVDVFTPNPSADGMPHGAPLLVAALWLG